MHIAFVLPDLRGGGAQKMIINLANEFSIRGHQVDLVLFNQSGIYRNHIVSQINVIDFVKKRSLWSVLSLSSYIRKQKPDILVSALFHVNLVVLIAKIFYFSNKIKVIISERNNLSFRLSEMSFVKASILRFLVKIFYPLSDKIIGISEGVCDDLVNIIGDGYDIQTIYNPVITKDFEEKIKREIDSPFPDNCGVKLIISGRLVLQKDYPTLFRALSLYCKKYGLAHLAILGDGALNQELIDLSKQLKIKDNITFLGFVDNPLAYMKYADIFVISSAWEGFCNVIVEALYAGLKIVSTNCPSGPAEILENGKYGELVEVGDAEQFAEKINIVAQKNISQEEQKKRSLDFTVEKKADEFEIIFKELLKNE